MCCPLTASARVDSQQALITLMNAASSSPCSEWDSPVFMPWLLWMHVKQPARISFHGYKQQASSFSSAEDWEWGVGGRGGGGGTSVGAECGDEEDNEEEDGEKEEE